MRYTDWVSAATSGLRSLENPSTPLDPDLDESGPAALAGSSSGVRVKRDRALTFAAYWRAVSLVSRSVAKLPLNVYRHVAPGRERDRHHPSDRVLFRRPNEYQTPFVFKQLLTSHVLTEGNGYALIERDGAARVTGLVPLNPDRTYPVRENGRLLYVYELPGGEMSKLQPWQVLHLKGLGWDGLTGYAVLHKARESLGLGLATQRFGARFFANSARPNTVLEVTGKMSETAKHNLRDSWERMHKGVENAHRTAILEEGTKVRELSVNARDAQLIESKQFSLVDLANWFGVPGHKLGDHSATSYGSLEQENQSYLDDAIDPWLIAWEEECEAKLLADAEQEGETHCVAFDRFPLVRADLGQRGAYYSQALANGWMSRDEVRARELMNPIEGGIGARYYGPLNMVPIDAAAPGGEGEAAPGGELLALPDVRQGGDFDCGPAAVQAVLEFLGVEHGGRPALTEALDTTRSGGTRPGAVLALLTRLGLHCTASGGMDVAGLARLFAAGHPVLCPVKSGGVGHWVAVTGVGLGHVFFHDPAAGPRSLPAAEWEAGWHDADAAGVAYERFGIGVGPEAPAAPQPAAGDDAGAQPVAGDPAEPTPADGGDNVQDTALNGAQIEALLAVVEKQAQGLLTPAAALAILEAAFPLVAPATLQKIVSEVKPAPAPTPAPAPEPAPVPAGGDEDEEEDEEEDGQDGDGDGDGNQTED